MPPLCQGVDRPLYDGLKTDTQLDTPTYRIFLIPLRPHNELGNGLEERLPDPHGAHPWTLIKCNESTCHHITVRSPGGGGVIHPFIQIGDNDYEIL